jgi:pimeloyl-ACP methyl ester carboxylesterase
MPVLRNLGSRGRRGCRLQSSDQVFARRQGRTRPRYANSLAGIPDGRAKTRGIAYGTDVAENLIALHENDGRDNPILFTKPTATGVWRPTPPSNLEMLNPWLGYVTPLVLRSATQFATSVSRTRSLPCGASSSFAAFGHRKPQSRWPKTTATRRQSATGIGCRCLETPAYPEYPSGYVSVSAAVTRGRPPAIALYSTPVLRTVARALVRRRPDLEGRLFAWQVGRFIRDPDIRESFVAQLYAQFQPARPAFWSLNDDLLGTVLSRRRRIDDLRRFDPPVRVIFGADDRYLNPRVARRFAALFPHSEVHLLAGAGHYVQVDEPARVADLIMAE